MILRDRFNNCNTCPAESLPEKVDLGRYYYVDDKGITIELTNSNIGTIISGKEVDQYILDFEDDFSHDILLDIQNKMSNDFINTFPMVQDLSESIPLTVFERKLKENLVHFRCMFNRPYSLLSHKIEKVNVARAKRIPAKGLQYLSSHSEDWLTKSVIEFQPIRIKHEELDENFDVYENQILFAFVERARKKVNKHAEQTIRNNALLEEGENNANELLYSEICVNKEKSIRLQRLQRLVIKQKEKQEEGDSEDEEGEKIAKQNKETQESLIEIRKTLRQMNTSVIHDEVNKPLARKQKWHTTNCLSNDKHYKCLAILWPLLYKKDTESNIDILVLEQKTVKSLKFYVESLIVYTLTRSIKNEYVEAFHIENGGDINTWTAKSDYYGISFKFRSDESTGILYLDTYNTYNEDKEISHLEIVPIGSQVNLTPEIEKKIKQNSNLYIVSYKDQKPKTEFERKNPRSDELDNIHPRIIYVDAYETQSAEKIGEKLIMPQIIRWYEIMLCDNHSMKLPLYNGGLNWGDCIHHFDIDFIKMVDRQTYKFTKFPDSYINFDVVIDRIKKDSNLKNYTKHQRTMDETRNFLKFIVDDINNSVQLLYGVRKNQSIIKEGLRCPHCASALSKGDFLNGDINKLHCSLCGCSLEINNNGSIEYSGVPIPENINDKKQYLGMDYIFINTCEH